VLAAEGYRVLTAPEGETGLRRAIAEKPDLILLDIMMPKMSGFEVCRKLKADPSTAHIPIIMVTALHEFGDMQRAVDCGTDDFVSKPVNKIEMLTRVKTMLKLKHLTDKLERTLAYLAEIEKQTQSSRLD